MCNGRVMAAPVSLEQHVRIVTSADGMSIQCMWGGVPLLKCAGCKRACNKHLTTVPIPKCAGLVRDVPCDVKGVSNA